MKLTVQGRLLYAKARVVVSAAREAEAEVRRHDDTPRGLLRISTPTEIPQSTFAGWIAEFLSRYPEVRLEVVVTSVHVDLVAEGFDVALRGGTVSDESLISRPLVVNASIAVASPAYLATRGVPSTPDELRSHDCIVGFHEGSAPERSWPLRDGGSVAVTGTLATNQMGLRLEAAKRGLGIALVIDSLASEAIDAALLVPVLTETVGRREPASLVYPDREYLEPKVRAFVDFIAERVSARTSAADSFADHVPLDHRS